MQLRSVHKTLDQMAKRKTPELKSAESLALKVSRSRAEGLIDQQTELGRDLVDRAGSVTSREEYRSWTEERTRWRKFTVDVLNSIYTTSEPADEFNRGPSVGFIALGPTSVAEDLSDDLSDLRRQLNTLVSLRERLEFIPAKAEEESGLGAPPRRVVAAGEPRVFVVHGHDAETKEKVVRQLEKAGAYQVVILHEQANEGRTLIEKFEEHASRSDYAVVLLTADDVGAAATEQDKLRPRGRQNVVFELGYFLGALGRSHVAVLYEKGVELPSDYRGVVYIGLDDETWRYKLLKELQASGFDYDLNQII